MEEPNKNPQVDAEEEKPWKIQMDDYKCEIERLDGGSDDAALAMGDVLILAREVYKGHGNWIRWMEDNLPFSVRQAQRRIKAAKFRTANTTLVSHLGLSATHLYLLARLDSRDVKSFLDVPHTVEKGGDVRKKMVQDMSKKELEFAVRNYLSSKLKSSNKQKTFSLNDTNQDVRIDGDSFESNFEVLKQAMGNAIASVKASDEDSREHLINILEDFCRVSMDTLLPTSKEDG